MVFNFKIHIVLFNSESLILIGKYIYFFYINGVIDEKRSQFTDFVTLINEKVELKIYCDYDKQTNFFY